MTTPVCPVPARLPAAPRRDCHPGSAAWRTCLAALAFAATLPLARADEVTGHPRPPTPPVAPGASDLFEDVTQKAGLRFVPQFGHRRIANIILSNGAGGAVLDFDQDGWMDIFLVNSGPLEGVTSRDFKAAREPNRLYRNRGDGTFEDVTDKAGLAGQGFATAAAAGDFDNDGFPDLYVVTIGRSQLFRNRGNGTFEDVTARAGVGHVGTGVSAAFLDADGDGRLDLFLANYLTFDPSTVSEQNPGAYPGPLAYPGEANVLYRNRGDGTFEDVTAAAGLHAPGHRAMSVAVFDCDRDGDPDIYVCNDDTPNALWLNDGKGHFKEIGIEAGVAFNAIGEAPGSMNAALADFNGDGWMDLFITRLGYGSLYVRGGPGRYDDRMWASGLGRLTQKAVGWGGVTIDFDNNGAADLFVANGDAFTLEGTPAFLLENRGDGRFVDASARGGAFFQRPVNGRGAAVLDFDNDGRLDLLITALADRPFLLRNRTPRPGHWLKLALEGRTQRDGLGALLTVTAGAKTWQTESLAPTGFLLQGDPRVHLGLGDATRVDTLRIRWPGGRMQELKDVAADQVLTVREPQP